MLARLRSAARSVVTVRGRVTLAATLVIALGVAIGAVALVAIQRKALTDNVRETLDVRADELEQLAVRDRLPASLGQRDSDIAAAQVIDAGGSVVSSTSNLAPGEVLSNLRPAIGVTATESRSSLPIDDDRFLVLARAFDVDGEQRTLFVAATLDPVDESTRALTLLLLAGAPLLVAFVGIVTWAVTGRALAPVEAISSRVEAISATGLDQRVPEPRSADEIQRLARTMNAMLERLHVSAERQQRFVADAAHELRSPLASLRAQLEAANPSGGPADNAGLLAEVVRLQHLADDLLLLARLDERQEPIRSLVDLDDIVLAEAQRLRTVRAAGIDTTAVSAGQVRGDPRQLERLVRNLLDNASRHAAARVVVRLHEDDSGVLLAVEDDGDGVRPEDAERVFERFTRLDQARDRESGGAGLGLAIVRAVVAAHDGSVAVDPAFAGGARFVVRLPAAVPRRGSVSAG